MQSPFVFGKIVSDAAFTNREKETAQLERNLLSGINTIIISPRRIGKSSLVEKVINQINQNPEYRTVTIDLFSIKSKKDFLQLYAKALVKASSSRWEEWGNSGKELFKRLIPRVSIGTDPVNDFSISFELNNLEENEDEILELGQTIANKKGIKLIVCIDEFQDIVKFSEFEEFEKKLRSIWQRHHDVCYCLYGSKKHMMNDIFNSTDRPFYRFGDIMNLGKISHENWVKFITESFEQSGKKISNRYALEIVNKMNAHSWYVQQFAHYLWHNTDENVSEEEYQQAYADLLAANISFFEKQVESISSTQLNLVKAILEKETQLTSARVMSEYQLGTPRNVSKNLVTLEEKDIIIKEGNMYEMADPVFEDWIRKIVL